MAPEHRVAADLAHLGVLVAAVLGTLALGAVAGYGLGRRR